MIRSLPSAGFKAVGVSFLLVCAVGVACAAPATQVSARSDKQGKASASRKAEETKKQNAKSAATAGATSLGSFGDWGAYTGGPPSGKVCFVLSQPKERLPKGLNRDPAYIFISFRPQQGVKNEIAVTTGYGLKPGSETVATLGKTKFSMVAKDMNAFLRNAAEETQFVELAKRTPNLTIKGSSLRGNETTDKYSLSGFAQSLDRAIKECQ